MPRFREDPQSVLADCVLEVAESASLGALGAACRRSVLRLTGSSTIGIYLLGPDVPRLVYSADLPDGFHEDYRTGIGRSDPFVDAILTDGKVIEGTSLVGEANWRRSPSYDFLRGWGFGHNMCGPLRCEDRIIGIVYTARPAGGLSYGPVPVWRMDRLCRAGSIALTAMARRGLIETGRPLPVAPAAQVIDGLPQRAAEVARLVCRGRTNKEIARAMSISGETVKEHVASLRRRFGAQNRTELVALLMRGPAARVPGTDLPACDLPADDVPAGGREAGVVEPSPRPE